MEGANMICILLIILIACKIRNDVLAIKLNCEETYKQIKKDSKRQKAPKSMFIIATIFMVLAIAYVALGFPLLLIAMFLVIFTLGGIAFIDTGADSTFYDNIMGFTASYFSLIGYFLVALYLAIMLYMIRTIYIYVSSYKKLKQIPNPPIAKGNELVTNSSKREEESTPTNNSPYQKRLRRYVFTLGALIGTFIIIMSIMGVQARKVNLENVVFSSYNYDCTLYARGYFFHKDNLYWMKGSDLYRTSFSCESKNQIADEEEHVFSIPFTIYNDDVIYYSAMTNDVNKVNLSTGIRQTLVKDNKFYLIPDTIKDGKALAYYACDYPDDYTMFATLDLNTGMITNEKKINTTSPRQAFYYCNKNDKIYYIQTSDDTVNVYQDNEILYRAEKDTNNYDSFVFEQDDYLFAVLNNKIIKFRLTDASILEEKDLDENQWDNQNTQRLLPCTWNSFERGHYMGENYAPEISMYPVFRCNNDIYLFHSDDLTFEKIIELEDGYGYLNQYKNYYILQTTETTTIYDISTKKYKTFDSVHFDVEDDAIYLMTYHCKKYYDTLMNSDVDFGIKKYALTDITN